MSVPCQSSRPDTRSPEALGRTHGPTAPVLRAPDPPQSTRIPHPQSNAPPSTIAHAHSKRQVRPGIPRSIPKSGISTLLFAHPPQSQVGGIHAQGPPSRPSWQPSLYRPPNLRPGPCLNGKIERGRVQGCIGRGGGTPSPPLQKVQRREANRRRHRLTEPTTKALCQTPPPGRPNNAQPLSP